MMANQHLPFSPIRQKLYCTRELLNDFREDNEKTFTLTDDFKIYRHYKMHGERFPNDAYLSMMQALHDNSINQAIDEFRSDRKIAGIMGGHNLARDKSGYRDIVCLTRRLTRAGIIVCSGGAVGAMEACHLGASLATSSDIWGESALNELKKDIPAWPKEFDNKLVDKDGNVNEAAVKAIHRWLAPAFAVFQSISNPAPSLAIPTWHYGFEPPTPFATHIAKYFQNSIREDGLVTYAKQGVVFTEGAAGTLQEIFQDAAQNKYLSVDYFSPMVFLGKKCWVDDFPVRSTLLQLFGPDNFNKYTLFTDDYAEAADFVENFPNH